MWLCTDLHIPSVKNKAKAAPGSDADDEEVYLEDYITRFELFDSIVILVVLSLPLSIVKRLLM
jgi:hypothetical protein